jgi:hypothetical protein
MTTNYNLNELLDQLDAGDRYTAFALLDLLNIIALQDGDPPRDKSTWTDKHYLIYLLHNTMMALLRKQIPTLAFGIAERLGHNDVLRQEKGSA